MRIIIRLSLFLTMALMGCTSVPTPPAPTATPSAALPTVTAPPAASSDDEPPATPALLPTMLPAATRLIPTPVPTTSPEPTEAATKAPPTEALPPPTPTNAPSIPSALERNVSPTVADNDLATLAGGNTSFALDLYRQLAGSDENLFFSPYSISLSLAMTYAGAGGETESQMAETLWFELAQDRLHPAFNSLDLSLASQSQDGEEAGFQLNIANSVWGQEEHGFLPDFLDTLALNYGGKVRDVDFRGSPEDARLRINDWVAKETAGRIEDLIPRDVIDRFTRLALANAVYFKAEWQSPFDERATSPAPFYALDGGEKRVETMRQTGYFGYDRGGGYQAVDLPYEGGAMSLTILLPDKGRFGEFESSLDAERLAEILEGLESTRVRLAMPRFELEASLGLADTLDTMGMSNAFDDKRAEFQGMDGRSCLADDDECLYISSVAHKAFVSVDEAGTEAAAATAVIIGITKAEPEEPINLIIDRPFIYLIRDMETGTVLFLGRVVGL